MPVLKYKCNKRLLKSSIKWGRRFLFAGILLLVLQFVRVLGAADGDQSQDNF